MIKKLSAIIAAAVLLCLCSCNNLPSFTTDIQVSTDTEVVESTINIKAVGDNLLHSELLKYSKDEDGNYNFDPIYENVKSYIRSADISVINQESAMVKENKRASGYPAFGTPMSMADTLIDVGFDVILQANNHVADKEESGFNDTIEIWRKRPEVTFLGIHDTPEDAGKIRFVQAKSIKIGMLNYTYGVNRETWPIPGKEYMVDILDEKKIEHDLARAVKLSDLVIAFLHLGDEYKTMPTEDQLNWVNHCIDNGASIVICAHPHVIQPYKAVTTPRGNKGLVYYSVGNFVSGQKTFETQLGGVADITLKKEATADGKSQIKIEEYGLEPIVTHIQKKEKLCRVYKLRDYTDELAAASDLAKNRKHKDYSTAKLWDLYNKVVSQEVENTALSVTISD